MKLIAYVSKVNNEGFTGQVVPAHVAKIISQSRIKNRAHDISGALYYNQSRYLQVIEGEEYSINKLFDKIVQDSRHQSMITVLNITTTEKFFAKTHMRLGSSAEKDPDFCDFMRGQSSTVLSLSKERQQALSFFYNLDGLRRQPSSGVSTRNFSQPTEFRAHRFSLIRWPDFNVVKPEPGTLDLCARMLKTAHTFDELKVDSTFKGDDHLEKFLLMLAELGILEKTPVDDSAFIEPDRIRPVSTFYQKMSRFLGRI